MLWFQLHILFVTFLICFAQNKTLKDSNILSRKKRYLSFPDGSNFVMTMSYVKSVMVDFPTFVNALGECDTPWKLPSDARWFRSHRRRRIHYVQKREIYSQLELALEENGLKGNACVKRLICEAQELLAEKGKSLVGDLLSTAFTFPEGDFYEDHNYKNFCSSEYFESCRLPLLHLIRGSLLKL